MRIIRQFLVHSFLYYHLDESIISDSEYDKICVQCLKSNHHLYKDIIAKSLGTEGSGFAIKRKEYPPEIISSALHLLYQEKYKNIKTFDSFLKQFGYSPQKL